VITKKQFAKMQDHSILGPYCRGKDVERFCREVLKYGFAAVYVNPCDVPLAKSIIGKKAGIGTVIGFPQGANTTGTKIFEGLEAIDNGATELDIVINISRMKDGDYGYVRRELTEFTEAMKAKKADVLVKVIIECFFLSHEEKIKACNIVVESGADYVKQSTGTTLYQSFSLGDIKLMTEVVKGRIKVKSAGYTANIEDVLGCVDFGISRIGNNNGPRWIEEFNRQLWFTKGG